VDESGKPQLGDESGIRFNLSHSGPFALIAVSAGREVGVDVEVMSSDRDLVRLAEIALSPAEAAAVRDAGPDQVPAFYEAWVRKEAVAKCLGVGLGAPLPPDPVFVNTLEVGPGMKAALAVAGAEPAQVALRGACASSAPPVWR
jgi:4'-phosphopantetheinyl transferase